jgi:hypothetical protein
VRWKAARSGYWLLVTAGGLLLFGHQQEFRILVIVICLGLPVALIWVCCHSFRLMFKRAASLLAEAKLALSNIAVKYPAISRRVKVAGVLAAVTVVSFLYFAGLIDLKSVQGLQTALLATP